MLTACSTPETAPGSLADGKERVAELVDEALAALDGGTYRRSVPGEQACRKTFLGYVVGTTGAHRAELPVIVDFPARVDARQFLDLLAAHWLERGYEVRRVETVDARYPKVEARAGGGYRVVMTAFATAPRLTVYAVSPCLRD